MSKQTKKGILLVVDDEPDVVDIYKELLSSECDTIITASNGAEALNIVQSGRVDAVVTDISMPQMTGMEFLEKIRQLHMQTPVIIVTGYGDKENVMKALRLDATDLIEKPFNYEALSTVIRKALDYGMLLHEWENAVDLAFANSTLPKEQIQKLKHVRKVVAGMKASSFIYANTPLKKKAG